ncbi:MAG TPA: alpha/beta hydrolase [Steroidobacteraceae bacterium]|nr:alpha/beta hydrolase [Steroidobacteraceae bacterium]
MTCGSSKASDSSVEVPGGSLFVRRWSTGPGAHPPILLLHDSLGSVEQWRDFPEALAKAMSTEVIAYDRLGFGKSSARTGRPSADFVTDEATSFFPALRDALGLESFVLFGHSVGGAMAIAIAAAERQACAAVITEAAQAFVEPRTLAGIRAASAEFERPEQFARLSRWHGEKARWVLDAWAGVWLSPQFRRWSLDGELPRVRCPVLAIHGELDEYGSAEFPRRITGRVGGPSELAILEDCGHVPHRERREDVLRLTAAFLERSGNDRHA